MKIANDSRFNTINQIQNNKKKIPVCATSASYTLKSSLQVHYYTPLNLTFGSRGNNSQTNEILSNKFDDVFNSKNAEGFLDYVNEVLLPLHENTNQTKIPISIESSDSSMRLLAGANSIISEVEVSKDGHIQIKVGDKNLFVGEEDGFDPVVKKGARGKDPFPQDAWNNTKIGREWPPAASTSNPDGIDLLSCSKSNAIMLNTLPFVGEEYGVNPRGFVALNKMGSSAIIAFQQANFNPDINFAAWSIMPFKIPEDKKSLLIVPFEGLSMKKYDDTNPESANYKKYAGIKDVENQQWNVDKETNMLIIDPAKKGSFTGLLDDSANWCIFATEGSDKICVVRSIYRKTHPDQFKAFSLGGEEKATKYVELEFIAPKVKKGQKSTIAYKIDFVPLESLGLKPFTSEGFQEQVKIAAVELRKRIAKIRRSTMSMLRA